MGATTRSSSINILGESGTPPCQRTLAVWGEGTGGSRRGFRKLLKGCVAFGRDERRELVEREPVVLVAGEVCGVCDVDLAGFGVVTDDGEVVIDGLVRG